MKNILTILKFELKNYFGSKSYMISTILLAVLCAGIMFAPRVIDAFTGGSDKKEEKEQTSEEDKDVYAYFDEAGVMDMELLAQIYPDVQFEACQNAEDVKMLVEEQTAKVGYVVHNVIDYDYYIYNKKTVR